MKDRNCQSHNRIPRLLAIPLAISLLTSCQTTREVGEDPDIALNNLNAPPEHLPLWSDSPLDSLGNAVGYLPRQTAKLLGLGKKEPNAKPALPKQKQQSPKKPQTPKPSSSPTPTPAPTPSSSNKPSQPKVTPKPKPKPKVIPKPKVPPQGKSAALTTPIAQPPASEPNGARNEILRGKTIQENPLGPRQPIELY